MFAALGIKAAPFGKDFATISEAFLIRNKKIYDSFRQNLALLGVDIPPVEQDLKQVRGNGPGILDASIRASLPERRFPLREGTIIRLGSSPHGGEETIDVWYPTFLKDPQIYYDIRVGFTLPPGDEIHVSLAPLPEERSQKEPAPYGMKSIPGWYRFRKTDIFDLAFAEEYKGRCSIIITNHGVTQHVRALKDPESVIKGLAVYLMPGGKCILTDAFPCENFPTFGISTPEGFEKFFFTDSQGSIVMDSWSSMRLKEPWNLYGQEGQEYRVQVFHNFFIYQKTEASFEESVLFYCGNLASAGHPECTGNVIVITRTR
jgi:hypothetical protein